MTELQDNARARFRELTAQRDAIRAITTPIRDERDTYIGNVMEQLDAYRAEKDEDIQAAEAPLFDIDQEIARLARFLEGKTGPVGTEEDLPQA